MTSTVLALCLLALLVGIARSLSTCYPPGRLLKVKAPENVASASCEFSYFAPSTVNLLQKWTDTNCVFSGIIKVQVPRTATECTSCVFNARLNGTKIDGSAFKKDIKFSICITSIATQQSPSPGAQQQPSPSFVAGSSAMGNSTTDPGNFRQPQVPTPSTPATTSLQLAQNATNTAYPTVTTPSNDATNSTQNSYLTETTPSNDATNSTQNSYLTETTPSYDATNSTQNSYLTETTPSNDATNSTQNSYLTETTPSNDTTNSTQNSYLTETTPSNDATNSTQYSYPTETTPSNDVSNSTQNSYLTETALSYDTANSTQNSYLTETTLSYYATNTTWNPTANYSLQAQVRPYIFQNAAAV